MNNQLKCFLVLANLFFYSLNGQSLIQQQIVVEEGLQLWNPLCGGLNNPQFSAGDLNNDGVEDLLIFDKDGSVILTFENGGTPNQIDYTLNPELKVNFPDSIKSWAMLRDFNLDGIVDLFSYSVHPNKEGIAAYQGSFDPNNIIQFTLVYDYLRFPEDTVMKNLYVHEQDYPAIDDIDNDGDIDVITFDAGGGYMEYYENQSVQLGYGSDSLIFELVDECWGRVYESGIVNVLELSPRKDSCPYLDSFIGQKGIHVGSNLLTWDMDNDEDKDLFLGDISFSTVLFAKENAANKDTSWIVDQETGFPSYDVPADIHIFPAMFSLDINNDGLLDFVTSPAARHVSEDIEVAWYYKNISNNQFPMFQFVKKDLVAGGMIDIGDETNPAFFDHNGDGLLDMVIGGYGRLNKSSGSHDASLFLYENIGTSSNPKYRLVNSDYGGLFVIKENAFYPAFGDFDGDGDKDMVVGDADGQLKYLENMDNGNGVANFTTITPFWQSIFVGQRSAPFVIDLNQDGLLDLVIGERNGNVNYYENQGTASVPNMVSVNASLGQMDARSPSLGHPIGYSAVSFDMDGSDLYCYMGTSQGVIRKYLVDTDSLITGGWQLVDGDFGKIREGVRSRIAIADINGDGENDYLIGNKRGGVSLYSMQNISSPPTNNEETTTTSSLEFSLWPNPTNDILNIGIEHSENKEMQLSIINALGQKLFSSIINGNKQLNVSHLASGVYFVELNTGNKMIGIKKFIKH